MTLSLNNKNILIVIVGPTAIGKTDLSISLATHYGCSILSADSRQFFAEMSIGTAVPSDDELIKAPHYFIQNKSIFETYTVGDFEKEAILKLDELFLNNTIQIIVGGSGLYIDAVLNGLDRFPDIEVNIRNEVRLNFETHGIKYLQDNLQQLDPNYFAYLSEFNPQTLQNPHRMMRFVEVCTSTHTSYSSFLNKHNTERNFVPIIIGLEAERAIIYDRINCRVDLMLQSGLLNEVTALYDNKNLNALQTVGYSEIFKYIDKEYSLDIAVAEIKKNTRRFSKRQLTWFKRNKNIIWFNYKTALNTIVEKINIEIEKVLENSSTF